MFTAAQTILVRNRSILVSSLHYTASRLNTHDKRTVGVNRMTTVPEYKTRSGISGGQVVKLDTKLDCVSSIGFSNFMRTRVRVNASSI